VANRVLLVDDEEDTLSTFAHLIRRLECVVDAVPTVEAAERALSRSSYSAVVTDLRLSGAGSEEGLAILDLVKRTSARTGVVVVTGLGDPEVMSRAYERGAAFYFEKPIDPQRLLAAITSLKDR
jgi:DNA-binding NtrC family response regulator